MKVPSVAIVLLLAGLTVIAAALLPKLGIADKPRQRPGKSLTVSYAWPRASAKVIEQNVTSKIEGLVSSVRGVESVSSVSCFGSGKITVNLKKSADVSIVKFDISSLLKQIYRRLPAGVTFPVLTAGEGVYETGYAGSESGCLLLTYQLHSNLSNERLKELTEGMVPAILKRTDGVRQVEVTGGKDKYIEISYNPFILAVYGLTANDIEDAILNYIGRQTHLGKETHYLADGKRRRIDLCLTTDGFIKPLQQMPICVANGKTVYLNELVSCEYKEREPEQYYRINGLNTIYLNIYVDEDVGKTALSAKIKREMSEIESRLNEGVYLTLSYDGARERKTELQKLLWRSLFSMSLLLLVVWLVKREWKYLAIVVLTLHAAVCIVIITCSLFDIYLHVYSLAGITVSLGLAVGVLIVMTDHYSYYHDRKIFMPLLKALLTCVGSLSVVLLLPQYMQRDFYDFSIVAIIALIASMLAAYVFVPALSELMRYRSGQQKRVRRKSIVVRWTHFYSRYISFAQGHRCLFVVLLVLSFGIPFHALPKEWEGHEWYNSTLGSDFFQQKCRTKLSSLFGGTMRLFAESISNSTFAENKEREMKLTVRGQMPMGGTVAELNEKIVILERFIACFAEIKRFETRVEASGATVVVEFKDEYRHTPFPYLFEKKVIGKILSIGGADWSTSGVSERGFSNSLNLQYRANRIEISGYDYDRLYRIANNLCDTMRKNRRVTDLTIETPGHETQEDELYIRYNKELSALYGLKLNDIHLKLKEILYEHEMVGLKYRNTTADMRLKSSGQAMFDLWHLNNAYLRVNGAERRIADFMHIQRRETNNYISKKNQEYILNVAFNVIGSYAYTNRYIEKITKEYNGKLPVGYRCQNASHEYYGDTGTQYWRLLLIVVLIYFVCSILFESLRLPLAIMSLVPVSFIGTFLSYYFTGAKFGSGGFASLVCLSGLCVSNGILIVDEYRHSMAAPRDRSRKRTLSMYVRAFNHKRTTVLLTSISTMSGLFPFFIYGKEEAFWFSFAVSLTGGLLFSVVAVAFVMPVMLSTENAKIDRPALRRSQTPPCFKQADV